MNNEPLYGPDVHRALVKAGLLPGRTTKAVLHIPVDDWVILEAHIAISREEMQRVLDALDNTDEPEVAVEQPPSPEDADKDRMRAIIANTKARQQQAS
ncbi:MAG: hypothetical protein ABR549_07385 [Mycobacteriales bacterium]